MERVNLAERKLLCLVNTVVVNSFCFYITVFHAVIKYFKIIIIIIICLAYYCFCYYYYYYYKSLLQNIVKMWINKIVIS
jgi:hypothetical protein